MYFLIPIITENLNTARENSQMSDKCIALCQSGKQCSKRSTIITDESLNVCINHKSYTIETCEILTKLIKDKIENDIIREQNKIANKKIMIGHEKDIPLVNNMGKIIRFAFVEDADYEMISKYSWYIKIDMDDILSYAFASVNNKLTSMHKFIMESLPENMIIDHKDGNGLNNRRSNLRFATLEQNGQNSKKKEGTSSKYKGVSWNKNFKKWVACYKGKKTAYLGCFDIEEEAAKAYDIYVLKTLGPDSRTNGFGKIDDELSERSIKELPKNIMIKKGKYRVVIEYNKKTYEKRGIKTLDEAIIQLDKYIDSINEIKAQEKEDHFNKEIIRNDICQAIIQVRNRKGEITREVPVNDDKWHELTQYSWSISRDKYYTTKINGKTMSLHRMIIDAKPGEIVDHINEDTNTVNTNTSENLRINDHSGNTHNKIKQENTSSVYKGVYYGKKEGKWRSVITKDRKINILGMYKTEVEAAIAYNSKAIELYGEFANKNKISDEDNLKYLESVKQNLIRIENKTRASIYIGVCWNKQTNKWIASIYHKKKYHIGLFND